MSEPTDASQLSEEQKILKFAEEVKKFKTNTLAVEYDKEFNFYILFVLKDGSDDIEEGYYKRFMIKEIGEAEKDRKNLIKLKAEDLDKPRKIKAKRSKKKKKRKRNV